MLALKDICQDCSSNIFWCSVAVRKLNHLHGVCCGHIKVSECVRKCLLLVLTRLVCHSFNQDRLVSISNFITFAIYSIVVKQNVLRFASKSFL